MSRRWRGAPTSTTRCTHHRCGAWSHFSQISVVWRAAGPRVDGIVVVVACVGQKIAKRETSPEVGLEPTTSILCYSRSGLKVQRSDQLSYLCLTRADDGYFRRAISWCAVRFSCGFRCGPSYFPRQKNPVGRCDCASLARILKELTRSPPSVAGVLYSDKRTKISAETGALGRFY